MAVTSSRSGFKKGVKDRETFKLKIIGGKDPFKNVNVSATITIIFRNDSLISEDGKSRMAPSFLTSPHYFPSPDQIDAHGYTRQPKIWERLSDGENTFNLTLGALHPNVMYDFLFVAYVKTGIPQADQDNLSLGLIELLKKDFDFIHLNERSTKADEQISRRMSGIISQYIHKKGELVDAQNKPLLLNTDSEPIAAVKAKIIHNSELPLYYDQALAEIRKKLIHGNPALLNSMPYAGLKSDIDGITGASYGLSAESQSLWDMALGSSRQKVKDIAPVIADGSKLKSILEGTALIDDVNGYKLTGAASRPPDPHSVSLLHSFFYVLGQSPFTVKVTGTSAQAILFRTTGFRLFRLLFEQLDDASARGDDAVRDRLIHDAENPGNALINSSSHINTLLSPIAQNNLAGISPATTALLQATLNPSINAYKDLKVNDAVVLLYNCYNNPLHFDALLSGEGVIDGTGKNVVHNPVKTVDIASLKVLLSSLYLINGPSFTDTNHTNFFAADRNELNCVTAELGEYINKLEKYGVEDANFEGFKTEMARLMADAFVKKSYLLTDSPVIDMNVSAEKNPYVGLDIGMGYAPRLHATFIHEGLNIYLRPVNKNAPLSSLHGSDKFFKMFSIFIGVTQAVSSSTVNDKYSSLFNEGDFKTSILFGAGIRFNRLMRLNIAGLFYREKSLNPLVTSTQIKVAPSVTLSLDINIAKLLTPIAKLFN